VTGVWVVLHGTGNYMGHSVPRMRFKFYPPSFHLPLVYEWIWNCSTGHEDEILAAVLAAAWLLLWATARRDKLRLHDLRAEGCFVVAFIAYLVLPRSILTPAYWWGINIRFATVSALFLALCIPGAIAGWRRYLLLPVIAVGIGFSVDNLVHWRRDNQFAAGYDQVAAIPPPHSRVLTIIYRPWNEPTSRIEAARNYYALYQAEHGGYMPWNFDQGFPLVYKQRFPAPDWSAPEFRYEQQARYYDYLMTFNAPDERRLFGAHLGEAQRVTQAGRWQLWKLPGPRVDEPPGPPYPWDWAYDRNWKPPAR
jgi:hypothetical protein